MVNVQCSMVNGQCSMVNVQWSGFLKLPLLHGVVGEQRLGRDVLALAALRTEADVSACDVLRGDKLLLALGAGRGQVDAERADAVNLHLLRVHQHLEHTILHLHQHRPYDVDAPDRAVISDMRGHSLKVKRLAHVNHLAIVQMRTNGLSVVLISLNKYWHNTIQKLEKLIIK